MWNFVAFSSVPRVMVSIVTPLLCHWSTPRIKASRFFGYKIEELIVGFCLRFFSNLMSCIVRITSWEWNDLKHIWIYRRCVDMMHTRHNTLNFAPCWSVNSLTIIIKCTFIEGMTKSLFLGRTKHIWSWHSTRMMPSVQRPASVQLRQACNTFT